MEGKDKKNYSKEIASRFLIQEQNAFAYSSFRQKMKRKPNPVKMRLKNARGTQNVSHYLNK